MRGDLISPLSISVDSGGEHSTVHLAHTYLPSQFYLCLPIGSIGGGGVGQFTGYHIQRVRLSVLRSIETVHGSLWQGV